MIIGVKVNGGAINIRAAPDVRPEPVSKFGLRVCPAAVRLIDRFSGAALN